MNVKETRKNRRYVPNLSVFAKPSGPFDVGARRIILSSGTPAFISPGNPIRQDHENHAIASGGDSKAIRLRSITAVY